jgi:peptide chain release factor 1
MIDTLASIESKYLEIQEQLFDEKNMSNQKLLLDLNRERKMIQDAYDIYQEYKACIYAQTEAKELLSSETDPDMLEMAREQLTDASARESEILDRIRVSLLPKDPNDDKNIFLEIRPGAGGDESGLFGSELLRMYLRYAERNGWRTEMIEHDLTGIGGLKFAMVKVSGDMVYSKLKFESGVHRVQRIPDTESNGRIHTSTVTVAAMPEVDDVEIEIREMDIEIDTFAASSAGGQNANKNQTGVRIHHKPTGLIVMGQDCKSQMQNKENAMKVLKSRLYQLDMDKQIAEQKATRLDQIGTGDRSEKIRTYNYPQDRVTDHRIKESWSNIPALLDGDIEDIVSKVTLANQAKLLEVTSSK